MSNNPFAGMRDMMSDIQGKLMLVNKSPIFRLFRKIGRNETCYCKSGKKYKRCCLKKDKRGFWRRLIDWLKSLW